MTSFLISSLAAKFRRAELGEFQAVHGHCWLVLEPGAFKPPSAGAGGGPVARLPTPTPSAGEALAVALAPRAANGGQVTVGRAPSSDVEINDGTLSQLHLLLLEESPGRWTARDTGTRNGSWLDGMRLLEGAPAPLADGARIQAGQVCLTFHAPPGMLKRLQSYAAVRAGVG